MRRTVVALVALSLVVSTGPVFAASASPMAACAAQWQAMKKAGTDKGTTYKAFSKECMSKAAPAAPAKTASTTSSATAKKTTIAPAPIAAAPAAPPVTATTKTATAKTVKTAKAAKASKAADTDPAGATANCKDGTYSHAKQHSGSCAGHGGVAKFLS